MMSFNIEKFTEYVPTATGSDLNALKPFGEEAEQWLQDKLLGEDLAALIAGLDNASALRRHTETAVCLKAYEAAIPFLDLVQTPNGFAVISNANQAPASKERVERLLNYVVRRLTATLDNIILRIHSETAYREEWKKAPAFPFRTETVFLTTSELRNYSGGQDVAYPDLDACHPIVIDCQTRLSAHISGTYLQELLQKRANDVLSDFDRSVFRSLQSIVGLMMRKEPHYPLLELLINNLVTHPDECPAFIRSPEYRLKISQKYENKKNDPAFFFGG